MKAIKLFTNLLLALMIGVMASYATDGMAQTIPTAVGVFALGLLLPSSSGILTMAVQVEIWEDVIQKLRDASNEFLKYCVDASDNVLNGSVVHIPQAGALPAVVKNRSSWPATLVQRGDTDIVYALDNYDLSGIHITDAEKKEISYDKVKSALADAMRIINNRLGAEMLYKWAASDGAHIIRTTGALQGGYLAPGATGQRFTLTKEDILAAAGMLHDEDWWEEGRMICVLPSKLKTNLLMTDNDLKARDFDQAVRAGKMPELYGFKMITRSSSTIYDDTATPVAQDPTAATAITDHLSALFYHQDTVEKAVGATKFFENKDDALLLGDAHSIKMKFGGRKKREDHKGVIQIVQTEA